MSKIRVVHYINQFFANIGGEEKADIKPELHVGEVIGPGMAFKAQFKDEAEIVATIVCGDSYFGENTKEATATIMEMIMTMMAVRAFLEKGMMSGVNMTAPTA